MSTKLFKIKPLKWDGEVKKEFDLIMASTPFGDYDITMLEGGAFQWSYCFDEYYDEGSFECDDVAHGKALAEKHWQDRIGSALEEY